MTGRLKACASRPPSACRVWIALNKICCNENWARFHATTCNASNKYGPIKSSCAFDRAHRLLHALWRPGGGESVALFSRKRFVLRIRLSKFSRLLFFTVGAIIVELKRQFYAPVIGNLDEKA